MLQEYKIIMKDVLQIKEKRIRNATRRDAKARTRCILKNIAKLIK